MYTEILMDGVRYFIRTEVLKKNAVDFRSSLTLTAWSDYVIKGNQLVKSRYPVEDLIRNYVGL